MGLRTFTRFNAAALLATATLAAAAAVACSGSPAGPSGPANLRLLLTDDPIDDVEEVNIYFTGVTAKPAGGPPERLALQLEVNPVDLLTLSDEVIGFAAGTVAPGAYEFIHVEIDAGQSYLVEKGVRKPLQVPSEEIKIVGGFTVDEDHLTTLTLDFDAKASLVRLGNGEWLLKPVVVVTGNDTSSVS
jgi:hypothetical protein